MSRNFFPRISTGPAMDYERLVAEIIELAVGAGREIMKHFKSSGTQTSRKADGSPVTLADMAADDIIRSGLAEAFPDVPAVSEEQPASHIAEAGQCFIVDPLDGTRGFSRGSREFTVNIAYVENGDPIYGVIFAPAFGRLFYNACDGPVVEKLRPPGSQEFQAVYRGELGRQRPNRPIKVVASWSANKNNVLNQFLEPYEVASLDYMSSSLKFCLIANGEADLYPRFGPTMEWDTAAGHALVGAAGGTVSSLDDSMPLTYGKRDYGNPFFVACAPGIDLQRR